MEKSRDEINIANLYQEILNEDMTAGAVFGGDAVSHAGIEATDWFAPGDARNPYGLGITTRNGPLSGKKTKKRRKKKVQKKMNKSRPD